MSAWMQPQSVMHALVVDDNPTSLRIAAEFMVALGYSVHLAASASGALGLFYSNFYGVVFMDFRMEFINGAEAISIMRSFEQSECRKPSRIIAVSSSDGIGLPAALVAAGADYFLSIPFTLSQLKNCLVDQLLRLLVKLALSDLVLVS